ncbi:MULTISPECIES: PLDc N-terminal domain-containing protein [unclassified Modestobacter]|uniref:PLDc N-terminal domain-containing protein n=1 Tax=unclassified Modestobacter TaxID=2643866 RepID=UPI0022AB3775|nr:MULTISPECIES: PLDc N-terminal domain-containing protein [unclassified Modestobacter]MCZ2812085.1 PLDc N-terminal domain-containing protein [Modestobacter sp. VKM Ac-2979]MCZ2843809.1 PLDc N-terminal domain-containing protein [Modestobacter sp. VKM Ac-2980]MCZ2849745.1 PLDc N-terminal domain-containing protein [Modestobacter sp. VKM Ac-2978]
MSRRPCRTEARWGRAGRLRRWEELSPGQQTAVLVLGSVQLSLAATAWADLATSPAEQVNGSKLRWALLIAVNWIGPLAWFRWGRRDRRPAAR